MRRITHRVEVHGRGKLASDLSIRLEMVEGGTFMLHLWRPAKGGGGGLQGTTFSRPEAIRAYALGLLDMADRFEVEARPVWEEAGGTWMSPEEIAEAVK